MKQGITTGSEGGVSMTDNKPPRINLHFGRSVGGVVAGILAALTRTREPSRADMFDNAARALKSEDVSPRASFLKLKREMGEILRGLTASQALQEMVSVQQVSDVEGHEACWKVSVNVEKEERQGASRQRSVGPSSRGFYVTLTDLDNDGVPDLCMSSNPITVASNKALQIEQNTTYPVSVVMREAAAANLQHFDSLEEKLKAGQFAILHKGIQGVNDLLTESSATFLSQVVMDLNRSQSNLNVVLADYVRAPTNPDGLPMPEKPDRLTSRTRQPQRL